MAEIIRINANQSLRYLALLQERLATLQNHLATRKQMIAVPLPSYKEPIPPPPPPIYANCDVLKVKLLRRRGIDQLLAQIFLATSEALAQKAKPRKPRPPA